MTPVLLDTGVIVALLDRSEQYHPVCAETIRTLAAPLVTCEAVIAESCYLLRNLPGASRAILENIESGVFQIPLQLADSAAPVRRILKKYEARRPDLADACLVHLAEQLHTGEILTLDRDFCVYRWARTKTFRLLIPLSH